MEKLICPACETENSVVLSHCKNCGHQLPLSDVNGMAGNDIFLEREKEMNAFVMIWLWLCVISNALLFVMGLFYTIGGRGPFVSNLFYTILVGIITWGFIALLKWKKYGFYMIAGVAVVTTFFYFTVAPSLSILSFMPLVSLGILYAILQLKKYGKSCWSQLE